MIDTNEPNEPWSDLEPKFSEDLIETMADDIDADPVELADSQRRERWLEAQDIDTVLGRCDHVERVSDDTRRSHNKHVYTDFSGTPAEIGLTDGFGATVDWLLSVRRRIEDFCDWEISNKRMVDGNLVLTIKPTDA